MRIPIYGECVSKWPQQIAALSLLLVLTIPALVSAQEKNTEEAQQSETQDGQSQPPQTKSGKSVKLPPPPLFTKHSRGMYRNGLGLQVIDATPQSPPLEGDDPGVPDQGEYEINFTSSADLSSPVRAFDFVLVDANYGTLPRILGHQLPTQIKLEVPLAGANVRNDAFRVGIGASQFGLKFNFYNDEHHGLSLSFYPQIEFAVPGSHAARKNLAEAGQTWILPLLAAKEFKYVTMVGNFAVNQPIHASDRDTTGALALGVGRAVSRKTAAMGEIRGNSTFDFKRERLIVANFGLMRGLKENVILYGGVGHSLFSDDGYGHLYITGGVKFLVATHKQR
jgi:hypothetical protein